MALGSPWIRSSLALNMPMFSRSFDFVVWQQKIASLSKVVSLTSMAVLDIPMACFEVSYEVICNRGKNSILYLRFF